MTSQGREDAILARIFADIGTTNKVAVEFGARDGVGKSNTHRLRVQEGWTCILLDSDPRSSIVQRAHLTAENINAMFFTHRVPVQFDLLSIDVDGNDFWLWKALVKWPEGDVIIDGRGEELVVWVLKNQPHSGAYFAKVLFGYRQTRNLQAAFSSQDPV
jgi:hypothetical protein